MLNEQFSQFIESLKSSKRNFSFILQQTYAEIMAQFESNPSTQGFNQMSKSKGFTDSTLRGVAHRMSRWFPTHFFKFQDALLKWEAWCQKRSQPFLLDRPQVTFVDLGCGTGAASTAILAILEQYHDFLRQQNIWVHPVHVNLIALDPVQAELDVYTKFIEMLAFRLRPQKIFVSFQTLCQIFPEGTPQLLESLSALQGHVLIVGMSNLIRWIWNEADFYWETGQLAALEQLQPAEVKALQALATQTNFDMFHVVGVATKAGNRWWWLPDKLSRLFTKFVERLRLVERPFGERWKGYTEVAFENPAGSYWKKVQPRKGVRYFVENLLNIDPKYLGDQKLHQILSSETLEIAWVKTQDYMKREFCEADYLELKLFEYDWETKLRHLRDTCLERNTQYLNITNDLPYHLPKNEESLRPRSLARLEEQIIAVAIGICFQKELEGSCPEVSYSYRLNPQDNEFLYQSWFKLHSLYHADIQRRLGKKKVCMTDIKSFFPNINQLKLSDILRQRLDMSSRCYEMLSKIIVRDCHLQTCYPSLPANYGLLQGHALSGLLANVMLQPVDERLIHYHGMKDRYHRYTDDITVTGIENTTTPDHIEEINHIQEELSEHDKALKLHSSGGKTHLYENPQELTRVISKDTHLNDLSIRFNTLFVPLFVMNIAYQREFHRLGWMFISEYQKLLASIGIYFSPKWLYRKLDEYSRMKKWLPSFGKLLKKRKLLTFPVFPSEFNKTTLEEWKNEFEENNLTWVHEKQAVNRTLSVTFKIAAKTLLGKQHDDKDVKRKLRRLKFSLKRLNVFGIDEVVPLVMSLLLSQPWNLSVKLACRALARSNGENELFQVIEQSPFPYVRAMALRALGSLSSERSIARLASVLNTSSERIEKLMVSEALLEIDMWQGITIEQILNWLQQETDEPYIHKNIVLILAQAYPEKAREILQKLDEQSLHLIVHSAIHYALTKSPGENLLLRPEPEVFRKYRADSYPTIEEFMENEGSYRFVS